jgi:prepilin peptidase CpaA
MVLDLAILSIFPALVIFAAISDMFTMTISNKISLALIILFFPLALYKDLPLATIGMHLVAALLVLVITFIFFARNYMGGGDAKLASSIALWFGFSHLFDFVLLASLIGGALTLGLLALRNFPLPLILVGQPWATRLHAKETGIPYGIAIAVGAMMVYPKIFLF